MNNRHLHEIFYRFPKEFPLPFVLDGATGTYLMKLGMPKGVCTETFVLSHPELIGIIQDKYRDNGSDAVYAPTFGANKNVMGRHGIEMSVDEINSLLVEISMLANEKKPILIAGDMSPTGCLIEPFGETPFEEVVDIYREQAQALSNAGVDFFIIETSINLCEVRAAVTAIREVSELPIFVTLTVAENGKTMSGDTLLAALVTLADLGINAFGNNCSTGPDKMLESLKPIVPYAAAFGIPLIAKPNAGMPVEMPDGTTHFPLEADEFGKYAMTFLESGIFVLGGCCGTDECHIAEVRHAADEFVLDENPSWLENLPDVSSLVSTNRIVETVCTDGAVYIDADDEFADSMAEREDEGDEVLFVNVPEGGAEIIKENLAFINLPLVLRGNPDEIQEITRIFNGRIIIGE